MKKLTFVAAMAIAAATFMSCGNGTPKANLKNDVDTLSYARALSLTPSLKEYLAHGTEVDTAYINDFIKGLNEGVKAADDKKKAAYFTGIQIGQQIATQMMKGMNYEVFGTDSTQTISLKNFIAGTVDGLLGKDMKMTIEEAQKLADAKMQQIKTETAMKQFAPNKEAGEKFLAENGKKEGVKTLPVEADQPDGTKLKSSIQYKVLKEGKGATPADTSVVKIHYEGKTIDGNVFDSSYERNQPVETRANSFIKGFTQALVNMPVGSTWEVYIPQELAYGQNQPSEKIQPFSTLIFKIELQEVK